MIYKPTLGFYRRLLKTMMKVFNGDYEMFHKVRIESRNKILENKNETDEIKIQEKIFFGDECRDFLLSSVLQGNLQENGNYRFKARKEASLGATHIDTN